MVMTNDEKEIRLDLPLRYIGGSKGVVIPKKVLNQNVKDDFVTIILYRREAKE